VEAALRAKAGTAGGGYKSGGGGSLGLGGDGGGGEPRQVLDLCDDLAGFEGLHQGETAQQKAEREALEPSHASPQVPPGRGAAAAAGGAHGAGAKACAVLPGKLFEEDAAVLGELLKVVVGGSGEVHTTYLPTSYSTARILTFTTAKPFSESNCSKSALDLGPPPPLNL
jgi:hypothetical protein